jgi:hypothetical protein
MKTLIQEVEERWAKEQQAMEAFDEERKRKKGNGKDDEARSDTENLPAAIGPDAYHGIAGEMVEQIGPHTESDPLALLVQILMAFGVLVGRYPYMQVEGDRHYPNLFGLLIGGTSKGRKGTSWGRIRSIFELIPEWPPVVSGLSSGEGFKYQVRDARPGRSVDAGRCGTTPTRTIRRMRMTTSSTKG